jgi:acetyl-CoA carboxylase carboxyl transferase subunit beta
MSSSQNDQIVDKKEILFADVRTPRVKFKAQSGEAASKGVDVPAGIFTKCDKCRHIERTEVFQKNCKTCKNCGHHARLTAFERIAMLSDSFEVVACNLGSEDPLQFGDSKTYADRLALARKKFAGTGGLKDAFVVAEAQLDGMALWIGAFEFGFMGGSMGCVVGEQIAYVFEKALETRKPAVVVSASGGARMQEGIFSLMQMAKTTGCLVRLKEAGIPYISILTDPTTGGVAASFAFLGDIILAEPHALIGFAGPRVIEQTMRQKLPEGFQRSEFLLQKGFIDRVVARSALKKELALILRLLAKK